MKKPRMRQWFDASFILFNRCLTASPSILFSSVGESCSTAASFSAAVSSRVRRWSSLFRKIAVKVGHARSTADWALKVSGRPQCFCLMLKVIILTCNPEVVGLCEMLSRKTVDLHGLKEDFYSGWRPSLTEFNRKETKIKKKSFDFCQIMVPSRSFLCSLSLSLPSPSLSPSHSHSLSTVSSRFDSKQHLLLLGCSPHTGGGGAPHTAVDVLHTKDFSIAYQRQHSGSC